MIRDQAGIVTNRPFDGHRNLWIVPQECFGVLPALTDTLPFIGEPRPGFLNNISLHAKVDKLSVFGNALAIHDVKLDLLERRRDLVLDDFDTGLISDDFVTVLDRTDPPNIEPHGGVELERIAAGRRLRAAEHDDGP